MAAYIGVFLACAATTFADDAARSPTGAPLSARSTGRRTARCTRSPRRRSAGSRSTWGSSSGWLVGAGAAVLLDGCTHASSEPLARARHGDRDRRARVRSTTREASRRSPSWRGRSSSAGGLVLLGRPAPLLLVRPGAGIVSRQLGPGRPAHDPVGLALVVNAVNLIDGLDGLAAGMVAIAAARVLRLHASGRQACSVDASHAALLSAIAAGIGDRVPAVELPPREDLHGGLGLDAARRGPGGRDHLGRRPEPEVPERGDLAVIVIPVIAVPLLVLGVPFLDVVLADRSGGCGEGTASPTPDKEHIHHRLLDIGHSPPAAVLLMYLWSAADLRGCALAIAFIDGGELVIAIVAGAILVATVLPRLIRDRSPRGSDRLSVRNGAGAAAEPSPVDGPPPSDRRRPLGRHVCRPDADRGRVLTTFEPNPVPVRAVVQRTTRGEELVERVWAALRARVRDIRPRWRRNRRPNGARRRG